MASLQRYDSVQTHCRSPSCGRNQSCVQAVPSDRTSSGSEYAQRQRRSLVVAQRAKQRAMGTL